MKEARVARGFYPVVVPIRSDKPTGKRKGDSSSVRNSGKTVRRSKGSGRPSDSRCRGKKEELEDVQELVMVHQTLESASRVVRVIIGRVIVQRWMMVLRVRRNKILEPTHMVRGPATILTILVKSVSWISCAVLRCLLFKTTMSVKLKLHFWWNLKVSVFRALFSESHEIDTRIPEVDLFGGRSVNFGDGASSKATSLSKLPVRNDALGDF